MNGEFANILGITINHQIIGFTGYVLVVNKLQRERTHTAARVAPNRHIIALFKNCQLQALEIVAIEWDHLQIYLFGTSHKCQPNRIVNGNLSAINLIGWRPYGIRAGKSVNHTIYAGKITKIGTEPLRTATSLGYGLSMYRQGAKECNQQKRKKIFIHRGMVVCIFRCFVLLKRSG